MLRPYGNKCCNKSATRQVYTLDLSNLSLNSSRSKVRSRSSYNNTTQQLFGDSTAAFQQQRSANFKTLQGFFWINIYDFHLYFKTVFECRLVQSGNVALEGMPPPRLPGQINFTPPYINQDDPCPVLDSRLCPLIRTNAVGI